MPSNGNSIALIDASLRIFRSAIDIGTDPKEAILAIPRDIRDIVFQLWQDENREVTFKPVVQLSDHKAGRQPWLDNYNPALGYHWRRLRTWLLKDRGYNALTVNSLDDASDKLLSYLGDPSSDTEPNNFRVQGLVIGRVQSGKTANYTALIAKAVDAGYKLVIVFAGIHNQLRSQTQQRLTLELGLKDDPAGVGSPAQEHRWLTVTNPEYEGDFRPGTVQSDSLGAIPVVAVVKKNATVLTRLLEWLQSRPKSGHLPTIIIDDEGDQASINTGGDREDITDDENLKDLVDLTENDIDSTTTGLHEELEPSRINHLIRKIISEFNQVSYIAYTATPFANVLTEPLGEDTQAGHSLYPRDFIVSLPTSDDYIGAEKLFGLQTKEGNDDDILDIISTVPLLEAKYLNPSQPEESITLPDSLKTALLDFVLAAAAKDYREEQIGKQGPTTMLIHTSFRKFAQINLGKLVREEISKLRNLWRYGYEEKHDELKFAERWEEEFQNKHSKTSSIKFIDIKPYIDRNFKYPFSICVFNSDTQDQLGYDIDPNLKVIVIGGNRLSRGITLEGLLVSYYTRKSNNYDTILQAARWFGYRPNYDDLTRLYTTNEIYSHFRHLALVEEDLLEQIEIFEQSGKTPIDISPLILTHPDLNITAPNRMGSGREYNVSFAGQFIQSVRLPLREKSRLEYNLKVTKKFISDLGVPNATDTIRQPTWREVGWKSIVSLIKTFYIPSEATNFRPQDLADYIIRQAEENNELTRWWISVITRKRQDHKLGTIDLGGNISHVNAINRSRLIMDPDSVGVLANPTHNQGTAGDDSIGLTQEQIDSARSNYDAGHFRNLRTALRHQRDPSEGLLCIYPVSQYSIGKGKIRINLFDNPTEGVPVIGLAMLFPPSWSAATRSRIGGPFAGEPI